MADTILVLNAGSSSLKFSLFPGGIDKLDVQLHGQVEGIPARPRFAARNAAGDVVAEHAWDEVQLTHEQALAWLLDWITKQGVAGHRLTAVGHRVVHGGLQFSGPVRIDEAVLTSLEALIPLAPLHQPYHVSAIRAMARTFPALPQVACFDTSFHLTQPRVASTFALPRRFTDEGVVRYGFHGLSYEYIASVLPDFDKAAAAGRTVVAHLGNGASLCALRAGKCMATTMSFTPLDGLPMGTRSGSLDPGVLLYLMRQYAMDRNALEDLLWHQSGLLGVSGISGDVRTLTADRRPQAAEALDLFVYRIGRELGSLAAALGGLDALVFTAGIGEHAVSIRERVCHDAGWLGLDLDDHANAAGGPRISRRESRVSAWVIPTNEELMIARHTCRVLGLAGW